jgi:hypothetical protein
MRLEAPGQTRLTGNLPGPSTFKPTAPAAAGAATRNAQTRNAPMRNMATLTAVASVLAIGMATAGAAPRFPSNGGGSPDALLQQVQRGGEQMGPRSEDSGARGRDSGRGDDGPGATRGGDRGPGYRAGERGERGMRGEGRMRDEGVRQRGRADFDVDRGRRGDRADRRSRVDIDVDRDRRRRAGRGGVDVYVGRGYGPGCGWLRRRALDTGSGYWWRRYRACMADL